ncbi:MAG: Gfo/Idh/MocA family oxidoreductase [Planctomycetia bacterium]|nr:Gfo/Idh/MocA family oxidoreductase [Planctomycetia bacterium]NCG11843.1 Gfo/Idh/MocA family oxidoreductase [Planctomycetia bacterium]NCG57186.1 Gfo/Idh/MocA family oxidoreductase [Pseudomonadota bacterium]
MKVAVIGVGHLGSAHARNWNEIPDAELVGVYDVSSDRAREIAAENQCVAFEHPDQIIDAVDAVSIVTPTPEHRKSATPFLEAGKAVLVEKPLAHTLEDAHFLCSAAQENDAVLQVGHIERFNPVVRSAIHKVKDPVFIECDRIHPFSLRSTETSVVHDLMIHDIDIVLHLIESELTEVDAHGSRVISPTEDLAHARLSFASGATAFVKTSRVAFSRSRKVRIFGPRQYISLDLVDRTGFQVSLDSEYDPADFLDTAGRLDAPEGAESFLAKHLHQEPLEISGAEPLRAELEAFMDSAKGLRPPAVSGAQGVRAMVAAGKVLESLRDRQRAL